VGEGRKVERKNRGTGRRNDRSGIVKIERTDNASWLKRAYDIRPFARKYTDYPCLSSELPNAWNMVIVTEKPCSKRDYGGAGVSKVMSGRLTYMNA